jgi:hypothetical protein
MSCLHFDNTASAKEIVCEKGMQEIKEILNFVLRNKSEKKLLRRGIKSYFLSNRRMRAIEFVVLG